MADMLKVMLVLTCHRVLVYSEPPTEQRLHHYLLQVSLFL